MQTSSIMPSLDSHVSSSEECNTVQEIEPEPSHEVLLLVLAYLPLYELLAMSEVCILLRDAVKKEVLLWSNIIVERPLSSRLSDEILMKITSKANGRLRTLVLMNCVRITDNGLQRVINKNPLISKLYIPGCTALTPEGVIRAVKTLSEHHHNLKSLQINGIYNMNKQHLQTLDHYLSKNPSLQHQQNQHPILYHSYRNHPTYKHEQCEHIIDVEICPKCDQVKMVFDCPRKTCKRRSMTIKCRGCFVCVPRCEECGVCVESEELEEAVVCADILCSSCWLQLPKCDFCNKAYCKRHANLGYSSTGSAGFICDICHAKFIQNL